MANNTYVLLAKSTVGAAGASSIDFTSIPQTYTDLLIKFSGRTTYSGANTYENIVLQFNGSTSNLSDKTLYTINGSSASSSTDGSIAIMGQAAFANQTANTFANTEAYIPNYAGSNNKSFSGDGVSENNATAAALMLSAGLWSNVSAITSIKLLSNSGSNFVQYSTAYLYGISNVNTTPTVAPFATGGDIITNDGTYWIHTFLSSGTFTPLKALSCDYLVVAGGGAGGTESSSATIGAGGGGAGGLRSTVTATGGGGSLESKLNLTITNYTVTVGAGGTAPAAGASAQGGSGSNSVFSTITAIGGGGGGANPLTGLNGGSGGGGGRQGTAGGTGTSNQGYAGGAGGANPTDSGGGGGGAGVIGSNASGSTGGNGGNGVATSITLSLIHI